MTRSSDRDAGNRRVPGGRLRDIEAVTDAALSRLDEQSLLTTLLERVKKVLQADTAAVLLLDRSSGQLVATAASGIEEEVSQGVRIPLGAGFAGRVAASREPIILNTVDHTTVRNPLLVDRGIRSLLGVPLLAGGNVIGVIHVGSLSGRAFEPEDVELLQLAADRASLALQSMMSQDNALAALALHRSLLPTALPAMPGLDLAARYVTGSGAVGGDWYDVYTPGSGEFVVSLAGHLPPVLAVPGGRAGLIFARPDPPIGVADDRQLRTATVFVPPGALLCCFTDGLVERRDQPIYHGIGIVAEILDEQIVVGSRRGFAAESMAEDACAAVMRALVGNVPAQDDIAVLMLSRHILGRADEPEGGGGRRLVAACPSRVPLERTSLSVPR
jgi:putative methionine-R-sulfoxide reductase with GAF domain